MCYVYALGVTSAAYAVEVVTGVGAHGWSRGSYRLPT